MDEASTSEYWLAHPCFTPTGTVEVPVFYPTLEEMRDFAAYLTKIEETHGAHLICGIAKIVPPPEFRSRKSNDYSDVDNYIIEQPVKEKIEGSGGIYEKTNRLFRKSMPVRDFRDLAANMKCPRDDLSPEEIEKFYWKTIRKGEPVYGADTPGTICDPDLKEFNMNHLNTILNLLNDFDVKIKGVNTVYLYFGMWKTTFPWHPEDMDLYSINYVHFGQPKFWYAIATESLNRFERFAAQVFHKVSKHCKSFLRHKTFIISPQVLKKNNIKFGTMIQYANEFIITFPRGYHMGFNTGYNCAESTNFASDRWIDFGKNALVCTCRQDSVEIDMRPFMKKFRSQEYDVWYNYWYGERAVKPKKLTVSKRQPIHDGSPVEKKKRRTKQRTKGARGPHIEETGGSSQYMDEIKESVSSSHEINNAWKQRVAQLWSNSPPNFIAEKDYNDRQSLDYPHCCICQYFVPKSFLLRSDGIARRSHRLLTKSIFAKMNPENSTFEEDSGAERLFRCSVCYIVVHQGCYPTGGLNDLSHWKCLRCRRKDENASCHICELRGGALIPAVDNSNDFIHVICALLNRHTVFLNADRFDSAYTWPIPKFRAPIKFEELLDPDYINAFPAYNEEGKFECEYCLLSREGLVKCSMCDDVFFHATCGRMAGVFFEFRNWPDLVVAVCPQHNDVPIDASPLSIGEKVRASVDGICGLVKAEVIDIERMDSCTVSFMDRNWSDDMLPSDIVECQCANLNCNGWHIPGAKIKVKWDDGLVYDGIFRNRYDKEMYVLRFFLKNSNYPSVVKVGRESIFARGEKPAD